MGSVGRDFVQNQGLDQSQLDAIADGLAELRTDLLKLAGTPERDIEIGNIAAAEHAARQGDEKGMYASLKKAGSWVVDVATKVGIGVATEAIKRAVGFQ